MSQSANIVPLEAVLFDIFAANDPYAKFKLPDHFWALLEAANRVRLSSKPLWSWKIIRARKEQRCRGGCTIKPGEKYYTPQKGHSGFKLCGRCESLLWRERDLTWLHWGYRKANKDHQCSRGCIIRAGDLYFIYDEQLGGMKMCARCMAMILYFKRVDELSPYLYLGWDSERKRPARVKDICLATNALSFT